MIRAVVTSDSLGPAQEGSLRLPSRVVLILVRDGTVRLLDVDGSFFALSATGAEMLQETMRQGPDTAAERIAAKYDENVGRVRADLHGFLEDLKRRKLIYGPASLRGRLGSTQVSRLLTTAFRYARIDARSLETRVLFLITLAYFSFRLFGWTRTIEAWQRHHDRGPISGSPQVDGETAVSIDGVVRKVAARHALNVGCKERSLVCWVLLRKAGLPASLVLGVDLFPLASHCWCELDSLVLSDYEDRCERFVPVLRYL